MCLRLSSATVNFSNISTFQQTMASTHFIGSMRKEPILKIVCGQKRLASDILKKSRLNWKLKVINTPRKQHNISIVSAVFAQLICMPDTKICRQTDTQTKLKFDIRSVAIDRVLCTACRQCGLKSYGRICVKFWEQVNYGREKIRLNFESLGSGFVECCGR